MINKKNGGDADKIIFLNNHPAVVFTYKIFVVFFIKLIYKNFTAGIAQLVEWKLPKL